MVRKGPKARLKTLMFVRNFAVSQMGFLTFSLSNNLLDHKDFLM